MPPVGLEPTFLVSERPKTHALDRTTTGIGDLYGIYTRNLEQCKVSLHYILYLASTVRMTEVNLKWTACTYVLIFFSDT
jgi:hypothetical protein